MLVTTTKNTIIPSKASSPSHNKARRIVSTGARACSRTPSGSMRGHLHFRSQRSLGLSFLPCVRERNREQYAPKRNMRVGAVPPNVTSFEPV
jgi:hypothetical protein